MYVLILCVFQQEDLSMYTAICQYKNQYGVTVKYAMYLLFHVAGIFIQVYDKSWIPH